MATEPIAVVGMAGIFPGAPDLATFWDNLVAGVDAVSDVPPDRVDPVFFEPRPNGPDRFYCRRGGFIDSAVPFDPSDFGIMPVAAAGTEPDQLLALATAARALADAGYVEGVPDPRRVGVVIGRGGYLTPATARLEQRVRTAHQLVACVRELVPDLGDDRLDAIRDQFQQALGPSHPEASIGLVPNLVASLVANRLDLQGPAYTLDAACASSLLAVAQAVTELEAGRSDLMLAGGVHHCHDVTLWSVFSQLKALSPSGVIRPFDKGADGILIGEGTGIVVLKRLADARRDDDRVYATIRGTGVSSDGRAGTLMSPASKGQVLAIERAWHAAELDPASVGLIEAHGSATRAGDSVEIATLRHVFEHDDGAELPPVGLGSVKSNIGHAMPASGIAGLIKSALALHHRVVPPTLHCDEPHPDLGPSRFEVIGAARRWGDDGAPRRVGINAFGFGGINAHVILEGVASGPSGALPFAARGDDADEDSVDHDDAPAVRWGRPRRRRPAPGAAVEADDATRLFVATGTDRAAVAAQLADDGAVLAGSDLEALPAPGAVRLAIADPTPKRIELARKVVDRGQAWRGRNDVWFAPEGLIAAGGRVAFAFPGVEPTFEARVDDVAAHFGVGAELVPRSSDLERQGANIMYVGRLLTEALAALHVRPDVVVGHSLGEWTAMLVAEAVTREAIDRFVHGIADGDLVLPDLLFLALGCGVDVAEAAIAGLPDIAVSHDNCPHQVIVCGSEASVAVAQERLKAQRVLGQVLPFRTGFHTPMFADYLQPFEDALGTLPLHPARIPMYSSASAQRFPDDEEGMRDLGRRLYIERVRFRELVENLYADGVRVFVQPGVGSVVGFVGDTLHDREHLAVAGAAPKRSGMAQLTRVAAALFVEGADVPLAALAPAAPDPPGAQPGASGSGAPTEAGSLVRAAARAPARAAVRLVARAGRAPAARTAGPRPASPAGDVADDSVSGPLADEFRATLAAVTEAGREVMSALAAGPVSAVRQAPAPLEPSRGPDAHTRPAPPAPAAGRDHVRSRTAPRAAAPVAGRGARADRPRLLHPARGHGHGQRPLPGRAHDDDDPDVRRHRDEPRRGPGRRGAPERAGPAVAGGRAPGRGRHHRGLGGARPREGRDPGLRPGHGRAGRRLSGAAAARHHAPHRRAPAAAHGPRALRAALDVPRPRLPGRDRHARHGRRRPAGDGHVPSGAGRAARRRRPAARVLDRGQLDRGPHRPADAHRPHRPPRTAPRTRGRAELPGAVHRGQRDRRPGQRRPGPRRRAVGPPHPVHRPPLREHERRVRGHDVPRGEPAGRAAGRVLGGRTSRGARAPAATCWPAATSARTSATSTSRSRPRPSATGSSAASR